MRIFAIAAMPLASLILFLSAARPAQAQAPHPPAAHGANASRYHVAVIDVGYIFKNYRKFNSEMEKLKKEFEATEGELRKDREQITREQEMLKTQYAPGSQEFKQADERIAEKMADFNLTARKHQTNLLEREARIFFQAYLEVSDAVKYFAQRADIGMVFRFNGDPVDPNIREDVMRGINRPIVYQNGVDITPDILGLLNRDPAAPPAARQAQRQQPQVPGKPVGR